MGREKGREGARKVGREGGRERGGQADKPVSLRKFAMRTEIPHATATAANTFRPSPVGAFISLNDCGYVALYTKGEATERES